MGKALEMVYAYIRVSTDTQTVENQRSEILRYCNMHKIKIDKFIEETISGTKDITKRKLGHLIKKLKANDVLIASELSRLGRSFYMIMEILNLCLSKGIKVITIKDNFVLGDNIESKVIAFAFSLSAEIERQLISQRTKEALYRLKREGKTLGRPKGSKNKSNILSGKEQKIQNMIDEGVSYQSIARKLKVHPNTIYKYKKIMINNEKTY